MNSYKEVDKQIFSGNLWRAKEILQGRLATSKYDTELYERYGNVLLKMQDDLEAGKYLFLSGVRKAEYENAIRLYLNRYENKSANSLFHTFPHSAQVSDISIYPESVLKELESTGYKPEAIKVLTRPESGETGRPSGYSFGFGLLIFAALILLGLAIQGVRGLIWLIQWIF